MDKRKRDPIDDVSTEYVLDIIDPSGCPIRDREFNSMTPQEKKVYPRFSPKRWLEMFSTKRVDE